MAEGVLDALAAIEEATGERKLTVIGYSLGGTLLACTLAYLAAKRERRIAAASFFAALTDFENPGELGVFIDEEQLAAMDQMMARRGFLEGREMATTFNMLRANDLIWSFVVNNYLLGKEPFPFDLLYWNSDSTRMPYAMHSFYLHKFYRENRLVERGGITLCGVPIDLRKSACRSTCCRRGKITSRRGPRPMPRLSYTGRHQIRAGRLRAHRWRGQSTDPAEIRLLDQRAAAARSR